METHSWAAWTLILSVGVFLNFRTVSAAAAVKSSAKPGVCPPSGGVGVCVEYCFDDSSCPSDEKCCSNGCGHQCMAPYTVKPGRCPLPWRAAACAEFCNHDGQCPGKQKCCRTTCGHACSEPC
ncbi:hypothetical protein LDENG_00110720 [Lucifuga dentata]|nr:hypothetical protein LDENG_00110720 [Lucifuga dentata]